MENRARFAKAANKRIVQEGLDRRKLERQLNTFEDDMLRRINENHDNAIWQGQSDNAQAFLREKCNARIVARAEAAAIARQMRKDTALGCLTFVAYAAVMLSLTAWTSLPVWGAAAFITCGALILVAFLYRLHDLQSMEEKK